MATPTPGLGSLLGKTQTTTTSTPGRFPLGVGGGIAQMIASARHGEYAFLTPEEEFARRDYLQKRYDDLTDKEEKWRKGLIAENDDDWDRMFQMLELKTGVKVQSGKLREERRRSASGALDKIGVSGFDRALLKRKYSMLDGVESGRKGTEEIGVMEHATMAVTALDGDEMNKLFALSDPDQITAGLKTRGPLQVALKGADAAASLGLDTLGGHHARRGVEGLYMDRVNGHLNKKLKQAIKNGTLTEDAASDVYNKFVNAYSRGDADFGNTGSVEAVSDFESLERSTLTKLRTSEEIQEMLVSGAGVNIDAEMVKTLMDSLQDSAEGKKKRDSWAYTVPSIYADQQQRLADDLYRLEKRDPYATEVRRVSELDGFESYKAALGIKGAGYEPTRRAAMIMAKDPAKASKAMRFFRKMKEANIEPAKMDVMFRQYLAESKAPTGWFTKRFDSGTIKRAKLAGMPPSDITEMSSTISNFIQTNEFKHIKAPLATRFNEFKEQFFKEHGSMDQTGGVGFKEFEQQFYKENQSEIDKLKVAYDNTKARLLPMNSPGMTEVSAEALKQNLASLELRIKRLGDVDARFAEAEANWKLQHTGEENPEAVRLLFDAAAATWTAKQGDVWNEDGTPVSEDSMSFVNLLRGETEKSVEWAQYQKGHKPQTKEEVQTDRTALWEYPEVYVAEQEKKKAEAEAAANAKAEAATKAAAAPAPAPAAVSRKPKGGTVGGEFNAGDPLADILGE